MKAMFHLVASLLFALAAASNACADQTPQPGAQVPATLDVEASNAMDYLLFLPQDYAQKEQWPLLLFLHGAGERGDDLDQVKKHGPPKLVETRKDFPFVVVSPQCKSKRRWDTAELSALLDDVVSKLHIDKQRIYVTGLSMGGFGSWALAAADPDRFAAIVPICGGGDPSSAQRFAHLPVWVFHGGKDSVVPLQRSQEMVDALKAVDGNVRLTIYPDAGHDSWTEAYNTPELYAWLLQQKRSSEKKE